MKPSGKYGITAYSLPSCAPISRSTRKLLRSCTSEIAPAIITLHKDTWTVLKKDLKVSYEVERLRGPFAGGFRWAFPVATLEHGKAGALPMLTMDLTVHSESNAPSTRSAAKKGREMSGWSSLDSCRQCIPYADTSRISALQTSYDLQCV